MIVACWIDAGTTIIPEAKIWEKTTAGLRCVSAQRLSLWDSHMLRPWMNGGGVSNFMRRRAFADKRMVHCSGFVGFAKFHWQPRFSNMILLSRKCATRQRSTIIINNLKWCARRTIARAGHVSLLSSGIKGVDRSWIIILLYYYYDYYDVYFLHWCGLEWTLLSGLIKYHPNPPSNSLSFVAELKPILCLIFECILKRSRMKT